MIPIVPIIETQSVTCVIVGKGAWQIPHLPISKAMQLDRLLPYVLLARISFATASWFCV
jgi:hypothetical protein